MIDDLIERYIALRDRKDAIKKEADAKTEQIEVYMDKIEQALAQALTGAGVDRMGGKSGVAFFQNATSATVADRDAFFGWLESTSQWHLADIRAAKKQIADWKDEHQDLPPGINWREARVVRVNRS